MNCVKLHETNCKYRMACDPGQCVTNICQKTIDDILEALRNLIPISKFTEPPIPISSQKPPSEAINTIGNNYKTADQPKKSYNKKNRW